MGDVIVTEEYVGDADYPLTVMTNKRTGKRKALVPINEKYDIHMCKGQLWVNDVLWFGRWEIQKGVDGYVIAIEIS